MLTEAFLNFLRIKNLLFEAFDPRRESIKNDLNQKQTLLKILGARLVELGSLAHSTEAKLLINEFLHDNPGLLGFGLATPDGQLIMTTANIDRSKMPNLLTHPKT